jgi:hypothetical protein
LLPISKSEELGILWSYNNKESNRWLLESMEACKTQKFVWWDVGWPVRFDRRFHFPVMGYIWTTAEQKVTAVASIEPESRTVTQSDRTLAREVDANWRKLGLHFNLNDPLHKYLDGKTKIVTLFKFSKIENLAHPKGIENFRHLDGRPVLLPIRRGSIIIIPGF